MHWVEKPGTSLEAMQRVTTLASQRRDAARRRAPGVRNFGSHIGRAEVADEVVGPNFTELWISIDPGADYTQRSRRSRRWSTRYPGLYRDLLTYLHERIKEVLTGASATIVVRLYGPDLDVLRAKAKEVEAAMADVAGVTNLKVEPQVLVPQIEIRLRPEAAPEVRPDRRPRPPRVHDAAEGAQGRRGVRGAEEVSTWSSGACRARRADPAAIRDLPIDVPAGAARHAGAARRRGRRARGRRANEINRENACAPARRDLQRQGSRPGSVAREIEAG